MFPVLRQHVHRDQGRGILKKRAFSASLSRKGERRAHAGKGHDAAFESGQEKALEKKRG